MSSGAGWGTREARDRPRRATRTHDRRRRHALKAWTDDFAASVHRRDSTLVRDGLHVPYTWVAPCLDQCFRIRLHNENHPGDQKLFALHVFMPELAPKGQAPAHEGADLERRVRWYYRAEVKDPRDTVHEIAREYASEVHRTNDCRSVIQRGIASTDRLKARALLDSRE